MGMDKYVLQTNSLSKSFGRTEILHGIDMSIEYGEIYGLIGQNGAGKTTLLRLISGLMKPTKGMVNLQTGKSFIGYMPQSCRFDDNTTVSEIIRFFARLRNADTKESVFLGKKLKLDMSKKVKHLSPGQQKKLQMIIAMTGEPDLYVLDEPTAGLDPNATFEMKGIIKFPCCGKERIMVYSGSSGQCAVKCPNCGKTSIFNFKEMTAKAVSEIR